MSRFFGISSILLWIVLIIFLSIYRQKKLTKYKEYPIIKTIFF